MSDYVHSIDSFRERLLPLTGDDEQTCLYRGQADVEWPVDCSAVRRLRYQLDDQAASESLVDFPLIGYLHHLIDTTRSLVGIPPSVSNLELLGQLQHHGAATNLIDFTRNPLIALWFACNERHEKDGSVCVLQRSDTTRVTDPWTIENTILATPRLGYDERQLWHWEPTGIPRVVEQDAIFVLGSPFIWPTKLSKVRIAATAKNAILEQLDQTYGINEVQLFSDLPGVARANGLKRSFAMERTLAARG